jgi:hypothetical protein
MTKLTRFVGACVLVVAVSGIALAGDVLTPPVASPPPAECTSDCPETKVPAQQQPDLGGYIVTATDLAAWLVASIQ